MSISDKALEILQKVTNPVVSFNVNAIYQLNGAYYLSSDPFGQALTTIEVNELIEHKLLAFTEYDFEPPPPWKMLYVTGAGREYIKKGQA